MPLPTFSNSLLLLALCASACGIVDPDAANDGSVLGAFTAHHGTPTNGVFPERNGAPAFTTNLGWEVVLDSAYITTIGVTVHSCTGAEREDIDMYWGALPEDIGLLDLETYPLGGVKLSSGDWCGVTVHYGPFFEGGPDDYQMPNAEAIGSSIWLRGLATKDGQMVPLQVSVSEPLDVLLALTDAAGGNPLVVTNSNNPQVTISKSYDKLFEDVDFGVANEAEIRDLVYDALSRHTFVTLGTVISP